MSSRTTSIEFLSWGAAGGRPRDISRAVGGSAWTFRPAVLDRPRLTPLRWLAQAIATAAHLARHRPGALIVTNPPIWLGLVAYGYARLRRAPLVLDSHPGGFGGHEDAVAARLQPLHRWLARRVAAVLVTDESWAATVRAWGGTPIVLWEAPVAWEVPAPRRRDAGDELRVLVVCVFGADEPVAVVIDALRGLERVRATVTGDPQKAPVGLVAGAPDNATFCGYLDSRRYVAAMAEADVVVTVSTERTSVMRSGCEAVWAQRPLVVSDSPATRAAFPAAAHVENDPRAVAAALAALRDTAGPDEIRLHSALVRQQREWEAQRAALSSALTSARAPHRTANRASPRATRRSR